MNDKEQKAIDATIAATQAFEQSAFGIANNVLFFRKDMAINVAKSEQFGYHIKAHYFDFRQKNSNELQEDFNEWAKELIKISLKFDFNIRIVECSFQQNPRAYIIVSIQDKPSKREMNINNSVQKNDGPQLIDKAGSENDNSNLNCNVSYDETSIYHVGVLTAFKNYLKSDSCTCKNMSLGEFFEEKSQEAFFAYCNWRIHPIDNIDKINEYITERNNCLIRNWVGE